MPMLPPLVPDLAGTDPRSRRDRGSSVTASSLDAKVARVQRRYASNYNITYVHQPAKPPVLEPEGPKQPAARDPTTPRAPAELPTSEATFAEWRAIEAQLHLDRDGVGEPLDAVAPDDAPPRGQRPHRRVRRSMGAALRRPSRKVLLGTTAIAMVCMLAIGGTHSWRSHNPDLAGGPLPAWTTAWIAARYPDAVAANPVEQPAPPRSAAAVPGPAASPAPVQDAMAEILALRPALQSTAALPFLPTAAVDRHGTAPAKATPAEAVATLRAPDTPAQVAELTPPPAPTGTAIVLQPKPAETVAPSAAAPVPVVAAETVPASSQAPAPTVAASKPVEVAAPPLPAPVPVVTVTAKPAPGSRAGTAPAMPPKPVGAAAPATTPAPVPADPPVPVPAQPAPERVATPASPASKPIEAAAPLLAPAVPAVPAVASPPPEHVAQADGSGDTAALPPGFTARQLTSTLALVNQMALLVHDMHDENIKSRAQMATLTGTVQAKASDFEQRLRLAEARSSVAAAIETGKEPAAAPDPVNVVGVGEVRPSARAPAGPHSMRDYRIRRASYDYAQLIDLTAPPDQAVPREVVVGDRVPGVGRVTAITVRGGAWVVQTDHGVIQ